MATEFNPGGAPNLNAAVKIRYEANSDTNAFTDALLAKLNGVATGANLYVAPNHTGDVTSSGDGATVIANNAVTYAKIQQAAAGYTIMARAVTGAGNFAALVAGTNGVLRRDGSGDLAFGTLATGNYGDATITFAKLANVATETVFGRVASGSGVAKALSRAELTSLVNTFTTSLPGLVPAASGGNLTTHFLRKDGSFALPPGGIASLVEGTGINIDVTDPANPVISVDAGAGLDTKGTYSASDLYVIFDVADSNKAKVQTGTVLNGGRVPTSRTVSTGTGLTGGGDLSADRTIALSSGAQASLAAADAAAPKLVAENLRTASYTLALTDQTTPTNVTMNVASANVLTIPANGTVAFPIGTVIAFEQVGAGVTTITAASGVTLNGVSAGSCAVSARWAGGLLWKRGTNEWTVMGGVGTVA